LDGLDGLVEGEEGVVLIVEEVAAMGEVVVYFLD
jgi:hypothetical protein